MVIVIRVDLLEETDRFDGVLAEFGAGVREWRQKVPSAISVTTVGGQVPTVGCCTRYA